MKLLIILLTGLLPIMLLADSSSEIFDDIEPDQHVPRKGENQQPQKLTLDGMPPRSQDQNLRQLKIRQSALTYYVDTASITSSKKDNIARLVTVAISSNGTRTIRYEGYDCGYKRYMAYGYAGSDGNLRPFKDQSWKTVMDEGDGRFRALLIDSYVCGGFSYVASREKILDRMIGLKAYKNQD